MSQELDTLIFCHCGNVENPHRFRHIFEPTIFVNRYKDEKGEYFKLNADDFKATKIEGKCKYSQCGRPRNMHGPNSLLKYHEFIPDNVYYQRNIQFTLPINTLCRKCTDFNEPQTNLDNHSSLTHPFTTLVIVENKTDHDIINIKGKDFDQTIWSSN